MAEGGSVDPDDRTGSRTAFDFGWTWQSLIDGLGFEDTEQLVRRTARRIRSYVDSGELEASQAVREMVLFVSRNECLYADTAVVQCTRLVLFEALDICASYDVSDRHLTRTILARLYSYHNKIDREVIYCLFNRSKFADKDIPTVLKRKKQYILEQVAGWRINSIDDQFYLSSRSEFYLELPLASPDGDDAESFVITDALYQQQDPDYVLLLLRHGIHASCVHLWPIIMSLDLRLTLLDDGSDPELDVSTWPEISILRYYCRSRSTFVLQVVQATDDSDDRRMLSVTSTYDDTLIVSSNVKPYIPADRYKNPAVLQHYCRLAIRKALLSVDRLPKAIRTLSLPASLRDYVDLLTD